MREAVLKYGTFYGALLVVGTVAWKLTSMATDAIGGHGTSLLNSANVGLSLGTGIAAVVIGAAMGLLAGKLVSGRAGVLDMGAVLAWGAYGFGTLRQIMIARTNAATGAGTRGTLTNLAIEALVVGVLVVAAAWFIERTARKEPEAEEGKTGVGTLGTAVLCGAAGCAVGVWLIGQTGYKGQVIGAAFAGGLLGGILGYAFDHRVRLWPLVAGCVLVTVAGPVVGLVTGGSDAALRDAAISGAIARWTQLTGLDGAAGVCLGIPVGLYVAKSLLGHAGRVAEDVG